MSPTNRLRFIETERSVMQKNLDGTFYWAWTKVKVLQQWWQPDYQGGGAHGEWRDVPLEVE